MDSRTPAEKAAADRAARDTESHRAPDGSRRGEIAEDSADREKRATETFRAQDEHRASTIATATEKRRTAAKDAKDNPARQRLIGPLTGRLAAEQFELEAEERAVAILDEAESDVGNDDLWYILTRVYKPDELRRLIWGCRAQAEKFETEKKAADEKVAAEKKSSTSDVRADTHFTPEPVPANETEDHKKARIERDRIAKSKATPAKPALKTVAPGSVDSVENWEEDKNEGTFTRYLAHAIVEATKSPNRP